MRLVIRLAALLTVTSAFAGAGCSAPEGEETESSEAAETAARPEPATTRVVEATDAQRKELAQKKATCPFVGAMVALKKLPILNSLSNPLARISDVEKIGDEQGGNLGRFVLKLFASGNHARMEGNKEVLPGTFSLDFPPSQGAHPGHSGVLIGGKKGHYTGSYDEAQWRRFVTLAVDAQGKKRGEPGFEGERYMKRSAIGTFIWQNVKRDCEAVYIGSKDCAGNAHVLARDLTVDVVSLILRPSVEKIVALTGTDHIVGSAGEFALMMEMLEVPGVEVDGEPVVRVADMETMFIHKRMPDGWTPRKMEASDWVKHTNAILIAAECAGDRLPPLTSRAVCKN